MDKALVFGTKDCRLESCQGHLLQKAGCAQEETDLSTDPGMGT